MAMIEEQFEEDKWFCRMQSICDAGRRSGRADIDVYPTAEDRDRNTRIVCVFTAIVTDPARRAMGSNLSPEDCAQDKARELLREHIAANTIPPGEWREAYWHTTHDATGRTIARRAVVIRPLDVTNE